MDSMIDIEDIPVVVLLLSGLIYSIYANKLTVPAAFTGLICGILLYEASGYTGVLMLTLCFLSGTLATSWGARSKLNLMSAGESTIRKSSQVLANAGVSAAISILMIVFPSYNQLLLVLLSTSLASATADTLSSELGVLYGSNFYNCLTWKKDECGLDGVVSLEGTLIGIGGALILASAYSVLEGFNFVLLLIIISSAAAGNFFDSILGASLERWKILSNNWVNFLSTVFAVVVALILLLLLDVF